MRPFESMHFLTGEELSQSELKLLIKEADRLRRNRSHRRSPAHPLKGKTIALIFEKPSLRTRVSFTVGALELGANVLELLGSQKKSEEPEDSIRVLQGMVHAVMLRTFCHSTLERMASKARIPVINGLSDLHHPCQALADLLTLFQRFGRLEGLKLAYVGDGNNVLHSLLLLAPFVGVSVNYCCPPGHQPNDDIVARAKVRAKSGGASIQSFRNPEEAVAGAHAVYTDVWTSMGFEHQDSKERLEHFKSYQLNLELFNQAGPLAIAMHCLPMVRGQEITDDVVEHPRSALFQQAENRLHAQKALMVGLFSAAAHKGFEYSHVI